MRHATFSEASEAILEILADGGWHRSTAEIHEPLRPRVSETMFGRVKKRFNIKHQQVGGGPGSYTEWHLCPQCADLPIRARCPAVPYIGDATEARP